VDFKHDLHRGLKSRQIAMVMPVVTVELMQCRSRLEELLALDSSLELAVERFMKILITSAALVRAGPAGVLISYILVGFVIYMVMTALGEMSAYLPLPEGFSGCTA
jgi:amino acid transporter